MGVIQLTPDTLKIKQSLLAALLLVGLIGGASAVQAAGSYDWSWNLNDVFGAPYGYNLTVPSTGVHLLGEDSSNKLPVFYDLGAGLAPDGTSIVVTGLTMDAIDGLTSALSGKASLSHTHSTGDITGLQTFVDNRISSSTGAMSFPSTTRSLNSAFQVSTTSAAFVSYTVDVATTLSLTSGQTGTVTLQYADDSSFTANVKTIQSSVNGNTGTLAIGLGLTQTSTASLTGIIPTAKYVKIVTANTAGTPTFTYRSQQEVLLPLN